jgi:hypothetical protein
MVKATVETFWGNECARNDARASAGNFGKWYHNAKQAWRRYLMGDKSTSHFLQSIVLRQQQKFSVVERNIKDTFFHADKYTGRQNVPDKTWRRHSAFLVYRQKLVFDRNNHSRRR